MTLVKFKKTAKHALLPGFNDVFETFFSDRMITRVPAVNISDSDTNDRVELAVPGLEKKSSFTCLRIAIAQRDETKMLCRHIGIK